MNPIVVRGWGAVSPAGWGVAPLMNALQAGNPLPCARLPGRTDGTGYRARTVPPATTRPDWGAHPRLRRISAISQFAVAAAFEALEPVGSARPAADRFGIVVGTHAACLRFSERFFGEALRDPATASPLLFPETVINAPASHLAAVLRGADLTYSLTGDQTVFVQALGLAAEWLLDERVDLCLVVGTEESGWPVADALRHHASGAVMGEGAGALVLARNPGTFRGPVLERVTDAHLYAGQTTREPAARAMRAELPASSARELLLDGRCGVPRLDRSESRAWADWTGPVWSPRMVLGEALAAASAWQCVAACAALGADRVDAVNVSVVGSNQQALGARFVRSPPAHGL